MEQVMEISGASGANKLILVQGQVLLIVNRKNGVHGIRVHSPAVMVPLTLNATVTIPDPTLGNTALGSTGGIDLADTEPCNEYTLFFQQV
jgi:hypothetical protein